MKNRSPLVAVGLLVLTTIASGFEPYEYQQVPFPESETGLENRLIGLVEILTDIAASDEIPAQNRAKILAVARRISPLSRRTFWTEYELSIGQKPTEAHPIPLEFIRSFLKPHIDQVSSIPESTEFLDFLEAAIKFEPVRSVKPTPVVTSADPFSDPPTTKPKPTAADNQCGFLSIEGCLPIGCYHEVISGTIFQYRPGELESTVFMSAYREALKYLALSGTQGLEGKRLDFTVVGKVSEADGPAGALGCAVLTKAVADNFRVDPTIAFSGDVNADGTVQPLDDMAERLRANPDDLTPIIVIPKGDHYASDDILILDGAELFTKTQILEVSTLDQAIKIAKLDKESNLRQSIAIFSEVQEVLNAPGGKRFLTNSHVKRRLAKILDLTPNHVSAAQLYQAANRRLPSLISLSGSLDLIFDALDPALEKGEIATHARLDPEGFKKLQLYRKNLDPTLTQLADAAIAFETGGRLGSNSEAERARVTQRLKEELNEISRNVKIRERMM